VHVCNKFTVDVAQGNKLFHGLRESDVLGFHGRGSDLGLKFAGPAHGAVTKGDEIAHMRASAVVILEILKSPKAGKVGIDVVVQGKSTIRIDNETFITCT
jgi:hypothetical protein